MSIEGPSPTGPPRTEGPPQAAAVAGLARSDPHGPGITRARGGDGSAYLGPSGAGITDDETLMALVLTSAGPAATAQARTRVIAASVREVARALGDTPAVARASYIDPRLISCYESEGGLPGIEPGARPAVLPAPAGAEAAVAALLASRGDGLVSC